MIARLAARPARVGIAPNRCAGASLDGGVRGGTPVTAPASMDELLRADLREQRATLVDPRCATFDTILRAESARVRGEVFVPPRGEGQVPFHKQSSYERTT